MSLILLVALASSVPTIDIAGTCREAQSAALPEDRKAAYESCLRDEQDARDKLKQSWSRYSAAAHFDCAETGGFSLSYVELLTCLEMQPGGSLSIQGLGASGQGLGVGLPGSGATTPNGSGAPAPHATPGAPGKSP